MATSAFKGSDTITYTPPGSAATTHSLAIPLYRPVPIDRGALYDWWAEDLVNRETVTIGDGVKEMIAWIRLDDEPTALKQMVRLAMRHNLTLTITRASVEYPVKLVAVLGSEGPGAHQIDQDADRFGYGEWQARLHVRRIDGGDLEALFGGTSS